MLEAFKVLKEAGGSMRRKEVIQKLRERLVFDSWESELYERTGTPRWEKIFAFYTIPVASLGCLIKNKGNWTLTPEGEALLEKGISYIIDEGVRHHQRIMKESRPEETSLKETGDILIGSEVPEIDQIERFEEEARDGIREFVLSKNPYEFQDLIAALLSAMGYFISHISPPGKDGGIDIIAYTDPLGTQKPRILVQVKHRPNDSISSDSIQKLIGTLRRESDVGIFATSGEFSKASTQEARQSGKHIELIDYSRLIDLWTQYYPKMSDEQKNMLPLKPIYFLDLPE